MDSVAWSPQTAFVTFFLLLLLQLNKADAGLQLMPSSVSHQKFVGDSFFVSCLARGRVEQLRWMAPNGTEIRKYSGRVHIEHTDRRDGLNLILENITVQDNGSFICRGRQGGRNVVRNFVLHVNRKTSFEGTKPFQTIVEGRRGEINCLAVGDPAPRVTWSKDGVTIHNGNSKYLASSKSPHRLSINAVSLQDAGIYTCNTVQLSSLFSNFDDFHINVTVHHAPIVSSSNTNVFGYVGRLINLTCSSDSNPPSNFTWSKDGVEIAAESSADDVTEADKWPYSVESIGRIDTNLNRQNSKYQNNNILPSYRNTFQNYKTTKKKMENQQFRVFSVGMSSYLQVNITEDSLFDIYKCRALNSFGSKELEISLESGVRPPIPTVDVDVIGPYHVTLKIGVKETSTNEIDGFRVEYKMAGDENWNHVVFKKGDVYKLTGLQISSVYVIRVFTFNKSGLSKHSRQILKKTSSFPMAQESTSTAASLDTKKYTILIFEVLLLIESFI